MTHDPSYPSYDITDHVKLVILGLVRLLSSLSSSLLLSSSTSFVLSSSSLHFPSLLFPRLSFFFSSSLPLPCEEPACIEQETRLITLFWSLDSEFHSQIWEAAIWDCNSRSWQKAAIQDSIPNLNLRSFFRNLIPPSSRRWYGYLKCLRWVYRNAKCITNCILVLYYMTLKIFQNFETWVMQQNLIYQNYITLTWCKNYNVI